MPSIKRVSIVTQTFPPRMGGMEAVMASLADHFSMQGADVCVYPDKPAPKSPNYTTHLVQAPKLIRHWLKRFTISQHSSQEDLIICDSWKSVRAIPKAFENIVVLAHGQEFLNTAKRKNDISCALARAKAIVCSSKATQQLVHEFNLELKDKTAVVYPTYMISPPEGLSNKNSKLSSPIQLLSISRLERRKGLQNAMLALNRLADQGLVFEWKIGGSGPAEKELTELCIQLGLNKQISFLGRVSDAEKHCLLTQADLFLMPTYQEGNSLEGFGISYVEASAFGLPSVGGIAGGANEAVNAPSCGWSCDGSNVESVYVALRDALSDEEERISRGYNALQRFNRELNAKSVFEQFLRICEETPNDN